jgi:hypothetical protein
MIVALSKFTFYRMVRAKVLEETPLTPARAQALFIEVNFLPTTFYDYAGPLGREAMEKAINEQINQNQRFFKKALAECKETNS